MNVIKNDVNIKTDDRQVTVNLKTLDIQEYVSEMVGNMYIVHYHISYHATDKSIEVELDLFDTDNDTETIAEAKLNGTVLVHIIYHDRLTEKWDGYLNKELLLNIANSKKESTIKTWDALFQTNSIDVHLLINE